MNDIRSVKHFIWDFDGTLFDTYPIIIGQMQTALAGFGHTIDPLELMEQLLHTVGFALEYCSEKFSIDYTQLDEAYTALHEETALQPVALPMESIYQNSPEMMTSYWSQPIELQPWFYVAPSNSLRKVLSALQNLFRKNWRISDD